MTETVESPQPLEPEQTAADGERVAAETPLDDVSALQAEVAQWKDTALRARADLDNFRKRMSQEMADARRFANAGLLEELLPILDNFQLGLQAAQNDEGARNLLIGLNMVAAQLQTFLRDNGVEEIPAVGRPFDPNVHEATGQQASSDVPEGTVVSQTRRGFKLRDRLLRPATVVVSNGPAAAGD